MAKKFTPAQETAINEQSKTLLVSAAAGSGKTTTLIERIIRSITRKENPLMLDRLLIVTFTKAAASELRLRVSAALSNAIEESGGDDTLAKQITLLPSANISTIDSFCLGLVRSNFSKLGLSPTFRMTDDGESALIASETMEQLLNECYDNPSSKICGGPESFAALVDALLGASDDKDLSHVLLKLEKKLEAYPKGAAALFDREKELREYAKRDFFECEHGKRIEEYLLSFFDYYKKGYLYCLDIIASNEKLAKAYSQAYEEDLRSIMAAEHALKCGYEAGKSAIEAVSFSKLGSYRGEKDEEIVFVQDFRKEYKEKLKSVVLPYVEADVASVSNSLIKTAEICHDIAELLCEYEKRAEAEKKRRGVCDFTDISRYALRLLVDENGNDTEFAVSQKALYDAVYIDEYQDVNAVQDRIFEAISTKTNRFMVGDIKQSIYGFRGAEPAIFAKMRHTYPVYEKANDSDGAAIFMSENFRCNKEVIDFTNCIFDVLMPIVSPKMGYTTSDSLVFKKTCESSEATPVKIVIAEKPPKDAPDADRHTETDFITSEIIRLVKEERKDNGEPFTYGDIAILISTRNSIDTYSGALRALDIPVYTETSENLLTQNEIMIVRSMLEAIDNPRRDISLCGAMLSPLCGLDCNFIANLRKKSKNERLITTLKNYIATAPDSDEKRKAESFIVHLNEFRRMARFLSAGELIDEFYTRYAVYARLGTSSEARRANLEKFKALAYSFGAESRTLYEFMRHIRSIDKNADTPITAARPGVDTPNAVRIMTVHKSKGLEFPAVFYADTTRQYNLKDSSLSLIYSGNAGFGLKLRDKSGFCVYDTLLRKSISLAVARAIKEEQLRLLYVALTRARERLYMTAMDKSPDALISNTKICAKFLTPYAADKHINHMGLTLLSVANNRFPFVNIEVFPYTPQNCNDETITEKNEESANADEATVSLLERRFEYKYPHAARTKIPAKLAISRLYPDILDDTVFSDAVELKKQATPIKAPGFIAGNDGDSAKRGTATHLFMQFFDFENARSYGAAAELKRLTEKHFLTEKDAALVNIEEVEAFLKSGLFADMCKAKSIYREQRFNLTLDAKDFAHDKGLKEELDGENVLVQGVIDCFYYDGDGEIILVDYKTDRLPRDRAAAEEKLRNAHSAQLHYYAKAIEEICGKAPKKILIYSLFLGDSVEI